MRSLRVAFVLTLILSLPTGVDAQSVPDFDMNAYRAFLAAHAEMSSDQLLSLHSADSFRKDSPTQLSSARYFPEIESAYNLTADEKTLLGRHGFVVTERFRPKSFGDAFYEIYKADLPVFISTDAILHALHMSYDMVLIESEKEVVIPDLGSALTAIHGQISSLATRYANDQRMLPPLADVDLYLTVARRLLGQTVLPFYPSTTPLSDDILQKIAAAQPTEGAAPLFADSIRLVDYSQFTPRGHYTREEILREYFQSMMWLGRTEFYLSPPTGTQEKYSEAQIQRQVIAALLLAEAVSLSGAEATLNEIDAILRFYVGESDNVTLDCLQGLTSGIGISRADELLDTLKLRAFQSALLTHGWAYQRILSQMLVSETPLATDQIQPASSFLLMGQRFVIDSYVTGSVVYDKIVYQNSKVTRMLPSTQDVLFALGNDASGQLLVPELDRYHYATNLAALRYLIDAYEPQFWRKTIYNGWLNAIRALNPPSERSGLPAFMQTAAWWQEKMNTQLSSWAELRHDNLLYAKQSYTGIPVCSYPCGYVEPVPEFYGRVGVLADTAVAYFDHQSSSRLQLVASYFRRVKVVMDTLAAIARKELSGSGLDQSEEGFLKRTLYMDVGCVPVPDGWYPRLYFGEMTSTQEDIVVADVHTSPADEFGRIVGWVLHAGTGPVNLAFVVTDVPGSGNAAFVGPVLSYYEHVTSDFKRLTDEEWQAQYAGLVAARPSWVNLYLADQSGQIRASGPTLLTGIQDDPVAPGLPQSIFLAQNYPNPFNSETVVWVNVPQGTGEAQIDLAVFDIQGRLVRQLVRSVLPEGAYLVRWDGRSDAGHSVASGIYVSMLRTASSIQTKKMVLIR
jgi:Protein of unknown function (DUF3160)